MSNREPQSGSWNGLHRIHPSPFEGFKNAIEIFFRNADSRVDDFKRRNLACITHLQRRAASMRVFYRIGQKVEKNLAQPLSISSHVGWQMRISLIIEGDVFGSCLRPHHVDDLIEELPEIYR